MNGFDLRARVAQEHPEMSTVFVAGDSDIGTAVRAIKAGALEFLSKPLEVPHFLKALGEAIDASRAAMAREATLGALKARHEKLTPREREVMAPRGRRPAEQGSRRSARDQ